MSKTGKLIVDLMYYIAALIVAMYVVRDLNVVLGVMSAFCIGNQFQCQIRDDWS